MSLLYISSFWVVRFVFEVSISLLRVGYSHGHDKIEVNYRLIF